MSDEAAQPPSLDELIDAACNCLQCLEQYCKRRMDDTLVSCLVRTLVDKAVQQDNSSRLQLASKPSLRDLKRPFKLVMPDIASLAAFAALVPAAYSA